MTLDDLSKLSNVIIVDSPRFEISRIINNKLVIFYKTVNSCTKIEIEKDYIYYIYSIENYIFRYHKELITPYEMRQIRIKKLNEINKINPE